MIYLFIYLWSAWVASPLSAVTELIPSPPLHVFPREMMSLCCCAGQCRQAGQEPGQSQHHLPECHLPGLSRTQSTYSLQSTAHRYRNVPGIQFRSHRHIKLKVMAPSCSGPALASNCGFPSRANSLLPTFSAGCWPHTTCGCMLASWGENAGHGLPLLYCALTPALCLCPAGCAKFLNLSTLYNAHQQKAAGSR